MWFDIFRKWQTLKKRISATYSVSNFEKVLWKLSKYWKLFLESRKWEEHSFCMFLQVQKWYDLSQKWHWLGTSIGKQNGWKYGLREENSPWKQRNHHLWSCWQAGISSDISSEHYERCTKLFIFFKKTNKSTWMYYTFSPSGVHVPHSLSCQQSWLSTSTPRFP
jgi:hypothetical protein